jgi:hypothetical protein
MVWRSRAFCSESVSTRGLVHAALLFPASTSAAAVHNPHHACRVVDKVLHGAEALVDDHCQLLRPHLDFLQMQVPLECAVLATRPQLRMQMEIHPTRMLVWRSTAMAKCM